MSMSLKKYISGCFVKYEIRSYVNMGGSPGLVVMGGDSRSKGRGFESQRQILDGHFSH